MTEPDPRTLEKYLLGDLSEEEMERHDRWLLEDPRAFAAAEAAEDDLVDAFVRGELSRRERARFRRRLLGVERIAERVATARALVRAADAGSAAGAKASPLAAEAAAAPVVPLERRRAPVAVRWAWAATLVALVGGGIFAWQTVELERELAALRPLAARAGAGEAAARDAEAARAELAELRRQLAAAEARGEEALRSGDADRLRIAELESEIGRLEATVARAADERPTPVERIAFALALGTRSADELPELRLPTGVDEVDLELGLDGLRVEGPLVAVVSRRGVPVWTEEGLPVDATGATGAPDAYRVRLRLPTEVLAGGSYAIRLTRPDGGLVGSYELTVVRP